MEKDENLIREDLISIYNNGFLEKKVKYETYADGKQYYIEIYPNFQHGRQEVKSNGSKNAETRK